MEKGNSYRWLTKQLQLNSQRKETLSISIFATKCLQEVSAYVVYFNLINNKPFPELKLKVCPTLKQSYHYLTISVYIQQQPCID